MAITQGVSGSGGGGGGGAVTLAAGSVSAGAYVLGSILDGAIVTLGALGDTAVGDATGSLNAHTRQIAKLLGAGIALGAGAAVIGAVTQSGTWNVTVNTALPAGSNSIGTVVLGAGAAVVGAVTQSGTWNVTVNTALPTGTNTIGAVTGPGAVALATDRTTAAAPFSHQLSDGAAFYVGAKTGQLPAALVSNRLDVNVGAATTLTANSTLQAGSATAGNVGGMEAFPTATFTRPADTTAYAANDAICNSTTVPAAMAFANAALRSGGGGFVMGATILDEANQTTKLNATLHLFSAVPATLTNDNAQMGFANADLANWLGALRYTATAVTNAAAGASGSVMLFAPSGGPFPYKCAATSLFGVLQADNAYTPVSAEVFVVTLQLSQDA